MFRLAIQKVVFYLKKKIWDIKQNHHLHRKSMIIMNFASYHVYHRVCFSREKNAFVIQFLTVPILFIFSMTDIRGFEQEVSVVTKKGVEARSYDGVSLV